MGEEIDSGRFTEDDRQAFLIRLREETATLARWLAEGPCDESSLRIGYELEAWIVDRAGMPVPDNERLLADLDHPFVVPELARFNVEMNGSAFPLNDRAFHAIGSELGDTWRRCQQVAHEHNEMLLAIGILPTLTEDDLTLDRMSPGNRYAALNAQVLKARGGRPIRLDIRGDDRLNIAHPNVLTEAATTSFQVHFQAPASRAVRLYNASCIASAPVLACAGNSPYLFQCALWEESRIPLFEQAVDISDLAGRGDARVGFGEAYLQDSIIECFEDNLRRFAPLLPQPMDEPARSLHHLRLHNGTIWRWNRPLVSVDNGMLGLRIEHRCLPAGPSLVDMIANAAFYIGLTHALATAADAPEQQLGFDAARENFYRAARDGLRTSFTWLGGSTVDACGLILDKALPLARAGLQSLSIDPDDIDRYLGIIATRTATGRTGARWQRAHMNAEGRNFPALVLAYAEHQRSGLPVHEWPL